MGVSGTRYSAVARHPLARGWDHRAKGPPESSWAPTSACGGCEAHRSEPGTRVEGSVADGPGAPLGPAPQRGEETETPRPRVIKAPPEGNWKVPPRRTPRVAERRRPLRRVRGTSSEPGMGLIKAQERASKEASLTGRARPWALRRNEAKNPMPAPRRDEGTHAQRRTRRVPEKGWPTRRPRTARREGRGGGTCQPGRRRPPWRTGARPRPGGSPRRTTSAGRWPRPAATCRARRCAG
jgi:hypothetical protein